MGFKKNLQTFNSFTAVYKQNSTEDNAKSTMALEVKLHRTYHKNLYELPSKKVE